LATITPTASSITQMAQIYGKDAEYASVINVTTTVVSIITMPVMVLLYQI
ncbi:MAG: autotransporter, partial [Clostridiaceae bacterium]|nr:autotransporter [Clostridiaceae bacterium]